ncbi:MAG: nucleotidyltransferase family protein [Acidobacteriota bacterium]
MQVPSEDGVATRWSQTLADAICDRPSAWSRLAKGASADVLRAATRHGVGPLLAARAPTDLPADLGDGLRVESVRAVARDAITGPALRELTSAFADAAIEALVFKGADLAYSCYLHSHLRPRVDSDILITPAARESARAVLARLGYVTVPQSGGDLLMYQEPFILRDRDYVRHTVDLHWRVANPQQFGDVAPFEDLWAESQPRPRLDDAARGLAPVHAFALACVHRVAHHYDDERLIWTYDLHQIARRMTAGDWERLAAWASARGIAAACARGVGLTATLFETPVPGGIVADLERAGARQPRTRRYLANGRHVERILSDIALLPSWTARARLARQHVFPSAQYMRDTYAPDSGLPVAILYVQRAWRGARRWMART